ncbi:MULTISPECIES: ABC transporter substrate-binding protein [unclassified Sphingobium]|uniref:ABC transporter substrate-binding protein n=1 Tax=unclassified Sphingobium TaxID=2611147 RepID=UPI000D16259B|nr:MULTISPECIES: ABC transporter substrate-binding protein [unclassified Sphingobium]MBG6120356.1 peptide/nickel transport system substrate-binding protein [Sphingobium sp. JAI105]PSO11133.1 ABC transporter substrate-binding protein [Sphingobium sp. AEW4]TWD05591.1 peptide/nickel transport system substrate-binding protein [Sphingobium sp. AEW010]TWD22476.1 peptide/nickel transport system substrate-binding protein [Sphingobium sp. AEW013]TWD24981.1 peptide/nickel transport system substrate-bind
MTDILSPYSRRGLIGAGLGVGAGLLLPDSAMSASRPRRGGRIRAAGMTASTADTLDPAKGANSSDYIRHYMFYSLLTQLDRNLIPQLELAERIESSDQINWHIRLRKGITFHDGATLTAQDVVWTLMRHKNPATGSKMAQIAEQFAEIRATSKQDVFIRLTGPNADLPAILAQTHFGILREGTSDFRTANGTGPFLCAQFRPGVRTLARRNPNFWKPGKPYLDEIELISIPDETSRVNALLSGDVHIILAVNPRSSKRIHASPRHNLMVTPSGLHTNLIMRQDRLPTGNPHFVAAIKYLFDRPLIKRALFRGYATIANDHPIPPFHPYYRADLPQRVLDLDKARWHLQRAGLKGTRLPIYASPAAEGSVDMASVLQEYGSRIGLNLAVNRVPADGYWSTHWMKHPMGFGNTNPRPTADLMFSLFYKSDAAWNESGWKNSRFDRLLVEARGEANQAKRKQLYGEMQELVRDYCGVSIPVFINLIDAHDRRLKGMYPIAIGGMMGYQFAEHVWWEG